MSGKDTVMMMMLNNYTVFVSSLCVVHNSLLTVDGIIFRFGISAYSLRKWAVFPTIKQTQPIDF